MQPARKIFNFSLLRRIFSFAAPYKKTLLFTLVMSVVLAVLAPVRPYLMQISVDQYIRHYLWEGLVYISLLHLVVLLLENVLRFWFLYRINWLGQTVVNELRKTVFHKILYRHMATYDTTPVGILTTRTINDIEAVNDVFSEGIISIVADILIILAMMCAMFMTDWRLTLICLIPFPLLVIATYFFKESVNRSFQRVRNAIAALNAFVQEHIAGMYLVQAFSAEERELERFRKINKEHRNANIRGIFAYSVFFPVVEIILAVSMGLLVWWGALQLLDHQASAGVLIAFILYLNLLFRPLRMLADKFNVLQMGMIAGSRVFSMLDEQDHTGFKDGQYTAEKIAGSVVFREVHFAYKKDVPVLKGISFQLDPGKTLALVGATGAGKTSVISILNRLYEINAGEILIDGIDLRAYEVENLRSHIGIVLQDVFLFSGTIRDNITLRNDQLSQDKIESVTRLLGIHEFISKLPGGYDFDIRERGNMLSQGQRQLLSFARALLYNPAILVLDEATSSVDSESEQLIQRAIDTLTEGRTAIVIAHRLSTIRKADEILVLDKGRITERGNHTELLKQQGMYYRLYQSAANN